MPLNLSGNTIVSSGVTYSSFWAKRVNYDGLVLYLDAGNTKSYNGGTTWYDLSGQGNDFTIPAGWSWNSNGYFQTDGNAAIGPLSNASTWGFNTKVEHYLETWMSVTTLTTGQYFLIQATPGTGSDNRAISMHLPLNNNVVYYDVAGCCGTTQRISYSDNALSGGTIAHMSFSTRTNGFHQREIFKNMISMANSSSNLTASVTWNNTTPVYIGSNWIGKIYLIRVYNRPLQPYEMAENFQAERQRFNI